MNNRLTQRKTLYPKLILKKWTVRSTKSMSVGRFGTFTLYLIMRKRNKVKRIDIMNIFYMKFTVLTHWKTFGACIITSLKLMRSCQIQITCFSKRVLDPSGKIPKIEMEENGLSPCQLRKIWKRNAMLLG